MSIISYDIILGFIYDGLERAAIWENAISRIESGRPLLEDVNETEISVAGIGSKKRKPRVQREIVATLARKILSGEIQPSEYLPKESELCAQYGVSRTVIREATKVLESKGLLLSRSRVGTRVLDAREWNMLDPDLLGLASSDFHDPGFVDSFMEARRIIEPAAAELAAERAGPRDLATLDDAYRRMCASLPDNVEQCSKADMEFPYCVTGCQSQSRAHATRECNSGVDACVV